MDPFHLIKLAWANTQTRIIFPGLLLAFGALLALKPITGGSMICNGGMCLQQYTAAFGTVKEAIIYPSEDLREFRAERGVRGSDMRIMVGRSSIDQPLTPPFTPNVREAEYIVAEGTRFITEGAKAHFAASVEVQGQRAFIRPLALFMLIAGAALAGHSFSRFSRKDFGL